MNETNEFKQIDLNQLQKVEVRDHEGQDWYEGYFLQKCKESDRPYRVLMKSGNGSLSIFCWINCKLYGDITKRPMTNREIFNALKKEDCWLRWPENTKNQFCGWNARWIPEEYEITYDGGETWHKLEVEI